MKWYTRCLAQALTRAGRPVTVLTARRPGRERECFDDRGVTVRAALDPRPFLFSWSFLKTLMRMPQRIVHIQHELYAYGGIVDAMLLPIVLFAVRLFFGKRVICTIHGVFRPEVIDAAFVTSNHLSYPPALVRVAWSWITAGLCRVSDLVQVHEQGHAVVLASSYACAPEKIVVVPIGVGRDEEVSSLDRQGMTVLFFGTLSVRKGIVAFVGAIPDILRRFPSSRIIIAGDVPARLRGVLDVAALCEEVGVDATRVELRGFVPDAEVRNLFASADVLVLPYITAIAASGPMALAMGYGVPVLLSDVFAVDFPGAPGAFAATPQGIADAVVGFFAESGLRESVRGYWAEVGEQRGWERVAGMLGMVYEGMG